MPKLSDRVRAMFDELPTNVHIIELAKVVHPTWIAAHGHANDPGVEGLAREIAQCITAIEHARESGADMRDSHALGHGILMALNPGNEDTYVVTVIAGQVNARRLAMDRPA